MQMRKPIRGNKGIRTY